MTEFLGDAVLELQTNVRPLRAGMLAAESQVRGSMARMDSDVGRRMASIGSRMSSVGSSMTRMVTVPILGVAGATAKMAADFDRSMELIHTQSGATQAEVNRLSKSVLGLAGNIKAGVPQSANDLAQALYRLEGAGLRGKQAMDALRSSAQLAAVGNANVEDTTKALAQTWFVAMKGTGDFNHVVGLLNATIGTGDLRLNQLTDALGTGVLPAAKQAGISLTDVLGAMAVFGDETNNVSGFMAQLATAFHFLENPTSKAQGALQTLGLSQQKLVDDMHQPRGLLVTLTDLKDRLESLPGGLHGAQAEQAIGDILPGGRGRVLLVLMNQLDRYKGKLDAISQDQGKFGADVRKTMEQPAVRTEAAWHRLQSRLITFGQDVLPPLLAAGTKIVGWATGALAAFEKLPPGAQHAIITGGLIMAGIGPALRVLGLFTGGIAKAFELARMFGAYAGFWKASQTAGGLKSAVATMEVGTLIAKNFVGGGPGGGAVTAAERDAAKGAAGAESASFLTRLQTFLRGSKDSPAGGAESFARLAQRSPLAAAAVPIAGVLAFSSMASAQGGALNKLNAAAHGVDPTNVLHLVGLPSVSDLLPGVKRKIDPNTVIRAFFTQRAPGGGGIDVAPRGGAPRFTSAGDPTQRPSASITTQVKDFEKLNNELAKLERHQQGIRATAFNLNYLADQAKKAGDVKWEFADRLGAELVQSRSVASRGTKQIVQQLDKLAPGARAAASQGMTQMARELEASGRLPRGSASRLVLYMLRQYSSLKDKGGDYFRGLARDAGDQMQFLEQQAKHESGKAKQETLDQIDQLRSGVKGLLQNMVNDTTNKMQRAANAVGGKAKQARQNASTEFYNLQFNIAWSMAKGVTSTSDGGELIRRSLAGAVKAFGSKAVVPAIEKVTGAGIVAAAKNVGFLGGAAGGALLQVGRPGAHGTDRIPMSVGGQDMIVGDGEKVAVFNSEQQRDMDRELRHRGGLSGFFQGRRWRPHHMATGGIVTASDYGGPSDPSTGSTGYRGDNLYSHPDTYAELNMGTALGGLPYMAPLDVTYGGRTAHLFKRDIGAGGPGIGGHVRAIDLWFQAAQALGMPGLANVVINGPPGMRVGVGAGTAGTASSINAPHVVGGGTVGAEVQAALDQVAKAANAYMTAHMPVAQAGFGGTPFKHGKYVFPLPPGSWAPGRVDQGWDLSAPAHTPEFALADGTVIGHGISGFGDWAPILRLDDGNQVYYGHAGPGNWARTGQRVKAGQTISEIGAGIVGLSTGPHLEIGFYPPGSMSAGAAMKQALGYQRGGITGDHGSGILSEHAKGKSKTSGLPKNARKMPKQHAYHPKEILDRAARDMKAPDWVRKGMAALAKASGDHGEIPTLQDRYQYTSQTDDLTDWQFVVTPPDGGAPYIDQAAVRERSGELAKLIGWQNTILKDARGADELSRTLARGLARTITQRQRDASGLRSVVRHNLSQIKDMTKHMPKGKAKKAVDAAVKKLKDQNEKISGDRDHVGTGGEIGKLTTEVQNLQKNRQTATQTVTDMEGLSGIGGLEGDTKYTLAQLSQQLNELSPGSLAKALADAGPGQNFEALTTQLQALADQQSRTIGIQARELAAFRSLPPYGGSFAGGGVVPGPPGAPRTIIAHGDEEISSRRGSNVRVLLEDRRVRVFQDDVEQAVAVSRPLRRRPLPGGGGGLIGP